MKQSQNLMYVDFEIYLRQPKWNEEIKLNTKIQTNVYWCDDIPARVKVFMPIIENELKKNEATIHDVVSRLLLGVPYYRDGDYPVEASDKPCVTVTVHFNYPIQTDNNICYGKAVWIAGLDEQSLVYKEFLANLHQAVSNVYKNVAKICYERKLP